MANLQTRVVNIIKSPATEWPVIAAESTDVGRLYKEYIVPLAAIGPIAQFIGSMLLGSAMWLGSYYRPPMMQIGSSLVVTYIFTLIGVYLCAMVIEWLAPRFKSSGSRLDALKLVAYASTPGWVAAVLHVIPTLAIFVGIAALYGIYLFYLGLPVVMKTPSDQVVPFMIVAALVVIVVTFVLMSIATALTISSGVRMI